MPSGPRRGKVWQWVYDSYGNCTQAKDPLLHSVSTSYSTLGWPTSVTSEAGEETDLTWDNLGRPTRATHAADGSYVALTCDGEGAVLTARDENGRVTTRTLNAMGWLASVTDASNHQTSFQYSPTGVLTSLTNARGKTTTWTLDYQDRPLITTYPDNTTEQVSYSPEGQIASTTDGRSNVVHYTHDTVGRMIQATYPTGPNTSISYRADDSPSSLTDRTGTYSWTFNARGEVVQYAAPQGTISYTFDAAGNRLSMARAGAGGSTSYTWDDASRLVSLTNAFSETTSFSLDAAGRITQQVQANGTKVLASYDSGRGWLNVLEHRKSDDTVLARYEYTRDLAGHITSASQPGVHSVACTYDNIYQLLREVRTGSNPYDISYGYDPVGNRISKTVNGVTESATYGDNNQILTAGNKVYTHDQDGNLTSVVSNGQTTSLAWDYNDKLTQISYPGGATNTFSTNDLGQRVSKTDSAGTTNYLRDGDDVIADSRADYTQGGITGLISERAAGTSGFHHGDQLTSTRGMTDSNQAVTDSREYDAFGLSIAATGTSSSPFRFAGGVGYQADADSGLMLLGHRFYDASAGRFINRDPLGYGGGTNVYGYCGNDPVDGVDPAGLAKIDVYFRPIFLIGMHTPFWHTYLVISDNDGRNAYVFTGGPANGPSSGGSSPKGGDWGPVWIGSGPYVPGARDWPTDPREPRRSRPVIRDGKPARYYIDKLLPVQRGLEKKIRDEGIRYIPGGPNSNTFVGELLRAVGVEPGGRGWPWAPGLGDRMEPQRVDPTPHMPDTQ